MDEETAKALRAPFSPGLIGKLPKTTCPACVKKNCTQHQKTKCATCKAYISTAHIHLDFVGHAVATDRLLTVDPEWTWEPFGLAPDGAPLIRREGGEASMWIRLTVAGVTRYGVGIAPTNSVELEKQLISDALRNAAMRFGVALDLWAKEDIWAEEHRADEEVPAARPSKKKDADDRDAGAAASPTGPTPVHQGGADRPPCEWTEAQIMAMPPPKLMNALKKMGVQPEGTAADWRAQLLGMLP